MNSSRELTVYGKYALIDRLYPNQKWLDGWSWKDTKGMPVEYNEYLQRGAYAIIYLKNNTKGPISISSIELDSRSIDEMEKSYDIVWHSIEPSRVPAGGICEIKLRIRNIDKFPGVLNIDGDGFQRLDVELPRLQTQSMFETIATSDKGDKIAAYISSNTAEDRVEYLELDGKRIDNDSYISYAAVNGLIAVVIDTSRNPLKLGEFHYLKAKTKANPEVVSRFRALGEFYPRLTFMYQIGPRNDDDKARVKRDFNLICALDKSKWGTDIKYMNHSNDHKTSAGWPQSLEEWIKDPTNYVHFLAPDEPDCHDYNREDIVPELRIGSNAPDMVKQNLRRHKLDPVRPTMLIVDSTFKPANYFTYARVADICMPDPYSTPEGNPPSFVYNVVDACHIGARPAPVWATLYCTAAKGSKFERYPSCEELRMVTYYALGRGVKGIGYWWYWAEDPYHGLVSSPTVWDEVSRLMAEVRIMEAFLSSAAFVPNSIAFTPTRNVKVTSLLNTEQGCAVAVINDDFIATTKEFKTQPVKDVDVVLQTPQWQKVVEAYHIDSGTARPIAFSSINGGLKVKLPEVSSASMIIFATKQGAGIIKENLKAETR